MGWAFLPNHNSLVWRMINEAVGAHPALCGTGLSLFRLRSPGNCECDWVLDQCTHWVSQPKTSIFFSLSGTRARQVEMIWRRALGTDPPGGHYGAVSKTRTVLGASAKEFIGRKSLSIERTLLYRDWEEFSKNLCFLIKTIKYIIKIWLAEEITGARMIGINTICSPNVGSWPEVGQPRETRLLILREPSRKCGHVQRSRGKEWQMSGT